MIYVMTLIACRRVVCLGLDLVECISEIVSSSDHDTLGLLVLLSDLTNSSGAANISSTSMRRKIRNYLALVIFSL
ncbi:hypothetical protein HNR39_002127 [Glaciimonas immobilis]|uniref:Uncharacterized protein n=1 Tax=Glaciimonas immobilis TaxID=728004 RepID=A0A840RT06_9BURK|nr:hypothetical protein [Glaciimonas immobilis]